MITPTLIVIRDITPRDRLQECLRVVVVLLNGSRFRTWLCRATFKWIGLPESQYEGQTKGLQVIRRMHPKVSHPDFGATNQRELRDQE